MKYCRATLNLDLIGEEIFSNAVAYVKIGNDYIAINDIEQIRNRDYERDDRANINPQTLDLVPYVGQDAICTTTNNSDRPAHDEDVAEEDNSWAASPLVDHDKEAIDVWVLPSLLNAEQLTSLSKAWNGWTQPAHPKGLGDNPFGLGKSIMILNLVVVTKEVRSRDGNSSSKFTLNRFNLLVDMDNTTEEDILRVLGRHYSQDPKEFHIGAKSLGHPDNPVPPGMQGYTYKSTAGLIIVGADKFIYFPKNTLLGDDGTSIALDGNSTVTGETLFKQGFNPVTLSMQGKDNYPILDKNTPLGKQKTKIDQHGCLITRIAKYVTNYT